MSFGMFCLFLPITIYLQSVLGMSALVAGLTMAPMAGTSMVTAPFAGRLADRIGGKYILMTGLACFAAGMALLAHAAGPDSQWYTFAPWLVLAGFGMGCTFAPMTTVAMRNIEPQMAGAASGVFNTTRQVGGAFGSAVVGAVLQNQLVSHLHDEAVTRSVQLPAAFRDRFVQGFSSAGRGGLEVGRGQTGTALQIPAQVPAVIRAHLAQIGHNVFVNGFVGAMKPTLVVPVVAMVLAAASCLWIQRRGAAAEAGRRRQEAAATAT
jgi:MFS family permease